jgi:hypothetical protein
VQPTIREFWAAAAVVASFILAGANLIVNAHAVAGWALVGIGLTILSAAIVWFFVWPSYERKVRVRVVQWLSRCGNFGTQHIRHGKAESLAEGRNLKRIYDEWHQELMDGVNWYCLDSDANDLRFLDEWTGPQIPDVIPTSGDGHTRSMAVEMVKRVRGLAKRLDQGETTLRRVRSPKKKKKETQIMRPAD